MAKATGELVVCIESHVSQTTDGIPYSVVEGTRLRPDDERVKSVPQYFVEAGLPDDEVGRVKQRLLARARGQL